MFLVKLYLQGVKPIMMSGLMDRRTMGEICINISIFSRVKEGFILIIWEVSVPRCVIVNMYRE